jgi:transposase-like protein
MTEDRLPLADLLAKAGDSDFLRSVAEAVVQLLMETDVEGLIGAGRHERTAERATYRNGYRDRTLDTLSNRLEARLWRKVDACFVGELMRHPATGRGADRALLGHTSGA